MSDNSGNLLFEYIRDIIYAPEKAKLDVDQLSEDMKNLGEGLKYLAHCILENKQFVSSLAKGDLNVTPPSADNVIAAPAKSLQGSLLHIIWQIEQVTKGDYGQKIDLLGEFSDSFNMMIEQLDQRTQHLIDERHKLEKKNSDLMQTQELFDILIQGSTDLVVLLDSQTGSICLANQSFDELKNLMPKRTAILLNQLRLRFLNPNNQFGMWNLKFTDDTVLKDNLPQNIYYEIVSKPIPFTGVPAIAHILQDRTEEMQRHEKLHSEAFRDPLTGVFNRRYAMTLIDKYTEDKVEYTIGMIDIDYLKYCNDIYGHMEGDLYIKQICSILGEIHLDFTLCRLGGDEFMLVAKDITNGIMNDKLSAAREKLLNAPPISSAEFTKSFSFGVCSTYEFPGCDKSKILSEADSRMYFYKVANKPKLCDKNGKNYKDDRIP